MQIAIDIPPKFKGKQNTIFFSPQFWNNNGKIKLELFCDITPIPYPQKIGDCFYIDASEYYSNLMSIFRGLLEKKEYSIRSLELTAAVIQENPSDTHVWFFREDILTKIQFNPKKELEYTDFAMDEGLKSYQAWNHRRWVVNHFEKLPEDLNLLKSRIFIDERNFHAWNYVLWLAKRFNCETNILNFTKEFIIRNHKNNSAWNTRFHLIMDLNSFSHNFFEEEIKFAFSLISKLGGNESCCSYSFGIMTKQTSLFSFVKESCEEKLKVLPRDQSLLSLMFKLADFSCDNELKNLYCDKLSQVDILRKHFWLKMKDNSAFS